MNRNSPPQLETKIKRLTREIARIDEVFYGVNKNEERELYAGMLERKRDDMVRSVVLQMHTAIEDLLNSCIICRTLNIKPRDRGRRIRSKTGRALLSMLTGPRSIGFETKLTFAFVLGLFNSKTKERLLELNTLRNRCSHNWLLKAVLRRGNHQGRRSPLCSVTTIATFITSTSLPTSRLSMARFIANCSSSTESDVTALMPPACPLWLNEFIP
jgi:hypothetical protein